MKTLVVFAICIVFAVAAPQGHANDQERIVVKESFSNNPMIGGGYNYMYELSNGESKQESAELKHGYLVIRGSFTYTDPETGEQYNVKYVADKNGFRPEGVHLPA